MVAPTALREAAGRFNESFEGDQQQEILRVGAVNFLIISSLRAFRRARDSEAKGRVDWKRGRWPRREKTEEMPKEAARGPQMKPPEVPTEGGTSQKRVGP